MDQRYRDTRKLALINADRLKRATRRKLEKQAAPGADIVVTSEMVSEALTKRHIDQIDDLSRRVAGNNSYVRNDGVQKDTYSTVTQIPYKPLKKNVAWLKLSQQDASSVPTLSDELVSFANYVQLDDMEISARRSMLLDIEDAVRSKYPNAYVRQFGSYPVGLSIFTSDIDISVDNAFGKGSNIPVATVEYTSELSTKRPLADTFGQQQLPPNKRIRFDEQDTSNADVDDAGEAGGTENDEVVSWVIEGRSTNDTGAVATEGGSDSDYVCGEYEDSQGGGGHDTEDEAPESSSSAGPEARTGSVDGPPVKKKLPLDIEVPVWDGLSPSSSNAALHGGEGDDGVLQAGAVDALMRGFGAGAGVGSSVGSGREQREAAERAKRDKLEVLAKIFRVIKVKLTFALCLWGPFRCAVGSPSC
jgi:predicted nucleotidyltransferase